MSLLQLISTSTLLLRGKQDTLIPFTNAADDTRVIARSRRVALVGDGPSGARRSAQIVFAASA